MARRSEHGTRPRIALTAAIAVSLATGCWTVPSASRTGIVPGPPPRPGVVVYSVRGFYFAADDGAPKHSTLDGRLLTEEIMEAWSERGYVSSAHDLEDEGPETGKADCALTVSGLQRNRANFWAQGFNLITLALLPYRITHEYGIEFRLEDRATGAVYSASASAEDKTWVELFLLFGLPFADRGHDETMRRIGDELYDRLCAQGAFGCTPVLPPTTIAPITP